MILPCAGEGSRLNLNYPKELFEIVDGSKLIDFSLNHILKFINVSPSLKKKLRIVTVITEKKESVFHYVKNRLNGIKVEKKYFNRKYNEWAGSVQSAENRFGDYNVVLLPDSFIQVSEHSIYSDELGNTLLSLHLDALKRNPICFSYFSCTNPEKLSQLGAVTFKEGKLIGFQDKPKSNFKCYNGFWGSYAFCKEIASPLYQFLISSIKKEEFKKKNDLLPFSSFSLYKYADLGTWESISLFKSYFRNINDPDT